ncbi:MAG TPA: ATP-binding protein [Flavilitoribacter sp.]|nr:ATP-binding protein [Flavilitoribacter sp.]
MKRICVTGPESSGKSTLTSALARHFGTFYVPEAARDFLAQLGRPYREADLLDLAREQRRLEIAAGQQSAPGFYFTDTGLEVIKIWAGFRFSRVHPWIAETLRQFPADLYLLCTPDLPWAPDPLRESPAAEERETLFQLYSAELTGMGAEWRTVEGQGEDRLLCAQSLVADYLGMNF